MSDIVIGIIAGSIVALISFILGLFGNIVYSNYQERKQARKGALRMHFEDLEKEIIGKASDFLSNINNDIGLLRYYNKEASYTIDASKTTWPIYSYSNSLKEQYMNFKEHFPSIANEIEKLKEEIKIINNNNNDFNIKLKSILKSKTDIEADSPFSGKGLERPYFSRMIVDFLRLSYKELGEINRGINNQDKLVFNFRKIKFIPKNDFLLVDLDRRTCAEVLTEKEAEKCKEALIGLMIDPKLQEESNNLYGKAEVYGKKTKDIANRLDLIIKQYSKFGKLLKTRKNCSVCELISE